MKKGGRRKERKREREREKEWERKAVKKYRRIENARSLVRISIHGVTR